MAVAKLIIEDAGDDVTIYCENVASDNQTPAQEAVVILFSKLSAEIAKDKDNDKSTNRLA